MPEFEQIVFLLYIGYSQNQNWFWVISTPKSLTELKGIYIRVNPSILEKGWGWLIAWRQRVVQLTLIDSSLEAIFIAFSANLPANWSAVILGGRLDTAAACEPKG